MQPLAATRVRRWLLAAAALCAGALAILWWGSRAAPLPPPAPFAGPLPAASPPPELAVYALPTGVTHRSAFFAYRGGAPWDARDFAMAAVLVRHPKGDVLIDAGLGSALEAQLQQMPWWFRAGTSFTRSRTAREQLEAAGYDPARLRAIVLTHAHWDHASGAADFPQTPLWVSAEERRFIGEGGWLTAVARASQASRFEVVPFDGGPYLGFPRSHDVYGDGALVLVPAPGHTPGSLIAFLTLADGRRFALLGDLVWQREGITAREERPLLPRLLGDHDPAAVRGLIGHVAALAARLPALVLVPAHDQRGFAQLPPLPPR